MNTIFNILKEITILSGIMVLVTISIKGTIGKKMSSDFILFLWLLVLVRLLIPISIDSPYHIDQVNIKNNEQVEVPTANDALDTIQNSNDKPLDFTPLVPLNESSIGYTTTVNQNTTINLFIRTMDKLKNTKPTTYLIIIWLVGAVILAIEKVITCTKFTKILKTKSIINLGSIVTESKNKLNIKRNIVIMESKYLGSPMTFGLVQPVIVLPNNLIDNISKSKLKLIVIHELVHIKRNDVLKNYLWMIAKIVHWYNPLVWFSYSQYLSDVESACDERVIKSIDKIESFEYSQSLIDVIKLSKSLKTAPQGMSFCEDKTKIRKRVEKMLKPTKHLKSAYALTILISLVMIIACFTTACKPTPDYSVIGSRNEDLVEKIIEVNQDEPQTMQEDKKVIAEQIEAVNQHLSMEFQTNDRVKILVDANVIMPQYDKIPMVRVVPENLTKEHMEKLIELTTNGEPIYYQPKGSSIWSKEEIDKILNHLEQLAQNNELPNIERSHLVNWINEMKNDIRPISPNKGEEKLYDGTLQEVDNNGSYSHITELKSYLGHTQAARIVLLQSFSKVGNQLSFRSQDFGVPYNTYEPYIGIDSPEINKSYDECKQIAEDIVAYLDGDYSNLKLSSSGLGYIEGGFGNYTKETSPHAYSFRFAREYNGVQVKTILPLMGGENLIDYSKQIKPEAFVVGIDNSGIVFVMWQNYTKFDEIVTEDVPLLDFETILSAFEKNCTNDFDWEPNYDNIPDNTTVTITIHTVELNMMMTPEKDDLNSYIIVPVWDFIGDMVYDQEIIMQDGYAQPNERNLSIITINAIDGTIIDREQGY